ncbi:MAG: hypothetical protein AB8F94_12370 [Saprospiraceae bacterium]
MKKLKLWFFLNKEDLKVFLKNFFPILILMIVLIKGPWIVRQFVLKNYDSETMGVVTFAEKIKGISDSETGGRVVTKFFHIEYEFRLAGNIIEKKEKIHRSNVNIKQFAKLNKLNIGDSILVKYDSKNHNNSRIKTD